MTVTTIANIQKEFEQPTNTNSNIITKSDTVIFVVLDDQPDVTVMAAAIRQDVLFDQQRLSHMKKESSSKMNPYFIPLTGLQLFVVIYLKLLDN